MISKRVCYLILSLSVLFFMTSNSEAKKKKVKVTAETFKQLKTVAIADVEVEPGTPILDRGIFLMPKLDGFPLALQQKVLLNFFHEALHNSLAKLGLFKILPFDDIKVNGEFQKLGKGKGYKNNFTGDNTSALLENTRGLYKDPEVIKKACEILNTDGIVILRIKDTMEYGMSGKYSMSGGDEATEYELNPRLVICDKMGQEILKCKLKKVAKSFSEFCDSKRKAEESRADYPAKTKFDAFLTALSAVETGDFSKAKDELSEISKSAKDSKTQDLADKPVLEALKQIIDSGVFTEDEKQYLIRFQSAVTALKSDINDISETLAKKVDANIKKLK